MKRQLIIVGAVLVSALLLFGIYEFFIKDDSFEEPDPFYILTDEVIKEMEKIEEEIEIVFSGDSETDIKRDESKNRAYLFALSYAEINKRISVGFDPDAEYNGIVIKKGNERQQISYEDIYKSHEDGTRYAFDGERLYTNAILHICGIRTYMDIELRALPGFDTDGDTVVSGRPFMYPRITRADVLAILITNQEDSYKVYRGTDDKFYFEGAELVGYDAEMLSTLMVNSTYVLATGKVREPLELSEYNLDSEENATAVITVITVDQEMHKILIGGKTPDNQGYYAKYHTKDFVYILPAASDFESSVLGSATAYLTAQLALGVQNQEDLFAVDNIRLNFGDEYTLRARVYSRMLFSSNFRPYADTNTSETLTDKVKLNEEYKNWTEQTKLAGFTSSDSRDVYLELPLAVYQEDGDYTVSFGLLRDDANAAILPDKAYITYSTDGYSFIEAETESISFSQSNRELKTYKLSFVSEEPVISLRLHFGTESGKYVVLDEVTVFSGERDAQPVDGMIGGYRLLSPGEYIPQGRNHIYPSTMFQDKFITSIATLVGDRVVDYGITTKFGDADTLNEEKLKKYGLDNPARTVSFEIYGGTTSLYFSDINENGNYYCYSIIVMESDGKETKISTDIIAEVSTETAEWLEWDIVDYFEQYLLSMFIDHIDTLTLTFDGEEYKFDFHKDDSNKLEQVTINGREVDLQTFRRLYISIIRINLKGEYEQGDGTPSEMLRIKVDSVSRSPEIVFYRVTTSKAFYTIDGEGRYYVLVDEINTIKNNVGLLLAGKEIPGR